MADYKSMYFKLAAKVADVVELLIAAQREGEHKFIEKGDVSMQLADILPALTGEETAADS